MTTPAPGSTENRISSGVVASGFEPVKALLDRFLLEEETYSAQLAAYWNGEPVVDLWGGPDVSRDSITGVFSCSKGVSALCIASLVDRGELDLDAPVARCWPEFAEQGKEQMTVRELLSHQSGLLGAPVQTLESFLDSRDLAAAIAASRPAWRPGAAFGYHALTIGVFMEELVRRTAGCSLQEYYDRTLREPYGIDFFLGLPEAEDSRYHDILPLAPTPDQAARIEPLPGGPDGLSAAAFAGPDMQAAHDIPNDASVRRAGPSAVGGVGSARGLASVYAAALTGLNGKGPAVGRETLDTMAQEHVYGVDRILHAEMAFGVVFMKPQPRIPFASHLAFGHDGAGGGLGYADPMYGLAFGYIPQRMAFQEDANSRSVLVSGVLRRCAANLGAS
ncbi:serine hydrolase domain-containing protein [Salana multivorans]